jgi:hypothetical protein
VLPVAVASIIAAPLAGALLCVFWLARVSRQISLVIPCM